ncbi:chaperone NapD [Vibrio panuliri]|uniref:Chaperone NapD n=1 Tax=Vibrio panuliri TaxID=1381081 RepID=A0A1Q9HJ82_9VIBR|nr:chaperone NapD [Vibrio panuliri]KAB1454104.1 chaperone NapD [Vibrio panuliri]OLQ88683.1 nitrate reductase [Vibrio panuliri]OLQ90361.1 nitrate reductase [Vibrio panuliri]
MPRNEVHISSLIVHVVPEHLNDVKMQIEQLDTTEIYGDSPEGKIVVVLETESHGFITDIIEKINNFAHVVSTVMVYHQIETELDDEQSNTGSQQSQVEGEV